ncbi:MAG: carbohydrate porin [Bacteroidetes bacterium]|nr:carbohydrate porin [Bacteroidota bacterium]
MILQNIILFSILCLCSTSFAAQEQAFLDQPRSDQPSQTEDLKEETSPQPVPRNTNSAFSPQDFGITLSADIKNEYWSVVNGGVQKGSNHLLNADLTIAADLGTLAGLSDAQFFVHFLANNGASISGNVGDIQMVSNIEGYRTVKLYQCWFEQSFPSVDLSFLIGVFDLNSEFYVTPSSALFLNGSHGVGIDLGQSGLNGPSIFPNTSVAVRLRYAPEDNLSFSAALFDGRPGAPDDCNSFDLSLNGQDGYFLIGETALEESGAFKYAAGVWYYTGAFADICAVDGLEEYFERKDNAGAYLLFDRSLYSEPEGGIGGMNMFVRFGMTNDHVNVVRSHVGGGLTYLGPISGRDEDELGYAFAYASFGTDFHKLNRFYGLSTSAFEAAHELTYRGVLTPWLALQYNVQYIMNPSASVDVNDAVVHGLRVEISL